MKKYLLAIALTQLSCSPCRIKDLRPISSIAELSDSCDIPPNLSDAWSCSVPKPLDASVASLRELHDACKLEDWTDKDHFSLNDGDSLKALEHYYWFQKQGLLGVKSASKLFLGKRLLPKDTPLIEIRLRKEPHISDLSKLSTFAEEITGGGVWGGYPNWHLPETNHNLIAIPDHFSIRTLRYALASRKVEDEPLNILILSKDLTYVSVYPPKSEQAEEIVWNDEIYLKTDADFLRISISDEKSILDLLSVITAFPTKKIELAMDKKPCETPPKGMRCVAGVDELDTFYIDIEPRDTYAECKKSGICRSTKGSWLSAVEQCNFQGKHLPSLYEYKAAQVSDDNVQWTSTWYGEGKPPLGRCGEMFPCGRAKFKLKSNGKGENLYRSLGNTLRCASHSSGLYGSDPFVKPGGPKALKPETSMVNLAKGILKNDNVEDKGICGEDIPSRWLEELRRGSRATVACRDPHSSVTSNEPLRYVWADYFQNIGGAYVGVGATQNYDFASYANAEWVWVFDSDPNIYRLHRMLKPLILAAETPSEFVSLFSKDQVEYTHRLIAKFYSGLKGEELKAFYNGYRARLKRRYQLDQNPTETMPTFGWLSNPKHYQYIRLLHQQDRIMPVAADMLGDKGFRSIGKAAQEMGVMIRVYYTSNAPTTAWGGQITEDYQRNVLSLPFDNQSLVLSTLNSGAFDQKGYWHYSVANGLLMQQRIASDSYTNHHLIWDRVPGSHQDVTVCRLPRLVSEIDSRAAKQE